MEPRRGRPKMHELVVSPAQEAELERIARQSRSAQSVAFRVMWTSMKGLLDYSDPKIGHQIRNRLDAICEELGLQYHGVRFRTTGYRQIIEVHLLFPHTMGVGEAHGLATMLEERLIFDLEVPAEVTTHLESLEDHSEVHHVHHYTGRPD